MAAIGGPGTQGAHFHLGLCPDPMFPDREGLIRKTTLQFERSRIPSDRNKPATNLQKIQFTFLVEKVSAQFEVALVVGHELWTTEDPFGFFARDVSSFNSDENDSNHTFNERNKLFSVLNRGMSRAIFARTVLSCYFYKAEKNSLTVSGEAFEVPVLVKESIEDLDSVREESGGSSKKQKIFKEEKKDS